MPGPLIGITCGTNAKDTTGQPQDRLNTSYSHAVALAGGIPVVLPNLETAAAALDRLDAVVLSGGMDLEPELFGEAKLNETVEVDARRDAAELPLIRGALARDLPILAICRGIQSLNVALGGTLYQDIPAQIPSEIQHRQQAHRSQATHDIQVEPGTRLAEIVGERMPVNSFHHQSVNRLGEGFRVTARAADGVIEGAELPDRRFVVAVQFHPEDLVHVSPQALRLFQALVEATRS